MSSFSSSPKTINVAFNSLFHSIPHSSTSPRFIYITIKSSSTPKKSTAGRWTKIKGKEPSSALWSSTTKSTYFQIQINLKVIDSILLPNLTKGWTKDATKSTYFIIHDIVFSRVWFFVQNSPTPEVCVMSEGWTG